MWVGVKVGIVAMALALVGCAETVEPVSIQRVKTYRSHYQGIRPKIAIGDFDNRIEPQKKQKFFDKESEASLHRQAKNVLTAHLQQSNRFSISNRSQLKHLVREAELNRRPQNLLGADFLITGTVSEFGYRLVKKDLFGGFAGQGNTLYAHAKVVLNVIDVHTSEVVFSSQGAGEYSLADRFVIFFRYKFKEDTMLKDKALDFAIREAVEHLVDGIDSGEWAIRLPPPMPRQTGYSLI